MEAINYKYDKTFKDIDEKNIKYKVELREENPNLEFKSVYEDINNFCSIDNLKLNTNYEIRISTIYNNFTSGYSTIQKVKTLEIDSNILKESKRQTEFINQIFKWSGYNKMELIYRGSRDGTRSQNFHEKCDNQGPTICLYKNEKGYIFGGYASISWTTEGSTYKRAPDSFYLHYQIFVE